MQCGDVFIENNMIGVVTKELGNNSYSVVYHNGITVNITGERDVLYDYKKVIEQLEGGIFKCVQERT